MAKATVDSHKSVLAEVEIPPYAYVGVYNYTPGLGGWLCKAQFTAYVHVARTRRTRFIPRSTGAAKTFARQPRKVEVERFIEDADRQFREWLSKGTYPEWDYDDEFNRIEGSERQIRFNAWVLLDLVDRSRVIDSSALRAKAVV